MVNREYIFPCGHKITSNIDFVGCRISAKKDGIIFWEDNRCMECSLIESKQYQMTNREYINQMTDEELAQWVITMNNYCKKCLALSPDSLCTDKNKGGCIKSWLAKKKPYYDNEEMKQRIRYNLVSKAESILNEIKERFPDTQITVEAPFPKGATVHLGDANIYVDIGNDLVIDAE